MPEHRINLDITFVCVYSLEFFFGDPNVSLFFKKKQEQKPPLIQAAFQCFVVAKAYFGKRLKIRIRFSFSMITLKLLRQAVILR